MAWIESHQSLSHHRKTLAVVAALKMDRYRVIGHLHELWWWGLDNADAEGHLGHVTQEQIADGAGLPVKDAHRFVTALLEAGLGSAGFLESDASGFTLHDWEDYAGKYNDQKQLRRAANRKAQRRRRQEHLDHAGHHSGHSGHQKSDDTDDTVMTGQHFADDKVMTQSDDSDDSVDDVYKSQHSTGPDRTNHVVVGSRKAPARARDPNVPAARAAPSQDETTDDPRPLPNGAKQCPTCPQVFTGSYADHLATASTHKIHPQPEDFSGRRLEDKPSPATPRSKRKVMVEAAEIDAELEAIAQRAPLKPADLPPELLAQHEAALERERQRKAKHTEQVAQ